MRLAPAISRILPDIVRTHHASAVERRSENCRLSRHLKVGERRLRNSRQSVEAIDLALFVDLIVKECTEFAARPLGRGVSYDRNQFAKIEIACHRPRDPAEHAKTLDFGDAQVALPRRRNTGLSIIPFIKCIFAADHARPPMLSPSHLARSQTQKGNVVSRTIARHRCYGHI